MRGAGGGIKTGQVVPSRWSPARREIERVLADGAWHEEQLLYLAVRRFVDPRLAARCWVRTYERNTKRYGLERASGSEMLRRAEEHVLEVGRRGVFGSDLRALAKLNRIERQEWNGRRRVRLKP